MTKSEKRMYFLRKVFSKHQNHKIKQENVFFRKVFSNYQNQNLRQENVFLSSDKKMRF